MPESTLGKLEEILVKAGIMEDLREKETTLIGMIKEIQNGKTMDDDTLIYRVAMTIYHSKRLTTVSILRGIEDPAALYLSLMQDKSLRTLLDDISGPMPLIPKSEIVRTLLSFIAAAYVFEKARGI